MAKNTKKPEEIANSNAGFAIPKENYKFLLIGLVIIIIGFILMTGGGSDDPNVFHEDKLFSFRRISLSTILVIFGFAFEVYAILKRPKSDKSDDTNKE